jgi:hypothetical protein
MIKGQEYPIVRTRLGAPAGKLKLNQVGCTVNPTRICRTVVNESPTMAFVSLHCPDCNKRLNMVGGH